MFNISSGVKTANINYFTTPTDINLNAASAVSILDGSPGDCMQLAVGFEIKTASNTMRTYTLQPYLKSTGPSYRFPPVVVENVTPVSLLAYFVVKFDIWIVSTSYLHVTLTDSIDEISTEVTANLYSHDGLPSGGVDAVLVAGIAPLTEDDIAGVILEDPTTPISNDTDGRVANQSSNGFSQG